MHSTRPSRRTVLVTGLAVASSLATLAAQRPAATPSSMYVYIGTYTSEKSQGIYKATLDLASGKVSEPELAATTTNPSFLALHPSGRFLYAGNEIGKFRDQATGAVSAFARDAKSGALSPLNQEGSGGGGPAHVSVDKAGRTLLVANYGGGSVASLPIQPDGSLKAAASVVKHEGSSVHPKRQTKPYAHSIKTDPSGTYAYAADLGTDKVFIYRLDGAASTLTPATPPAVSLAPGSGPRHTTFSADGRFLYVINELSLTVTVFARDAKTGALKDVQTIGTLPAGVAADPAFSTAEIVMHPSGRFLFGSNRGHDSLVVFAVDPTAGTLTLVEHEPTQGQTPRGFGVDPTGKFLLAGNQRSDTVVVFSIDGKTGALTPTGQTITVGSPVSFVFAPVSQ